MATRAEGGTGDEILINVTPRETRVAVVENGVLQEILIERAGKRGLVGNIYKGRVARVLPGMEAAFVDIGLERAAFLHVSDIRPESVPLSEAAANGDRAAIAITRPATPRRPASARSSGARRASGDGLRRWRDRTPLPASRRTTPWCGRATRR